MRAASALTFQPGQVTKTFTVTVKGDTLLESTESFNVILSGEGNATIGDGIGTGTIVNDDGTGTIPPPEGFQVGMWLPTSDPATVWRHQGE